MTALRDHSNPPPARRLLSRAALLAPVVLLSASLLVAAALAGQASPPARYAPVREYAQGIVRGVEDGGEILLVEFRRNDELLRADESAIDIFDRSREERNARGMVRRSADADRLRRIDLSRAQGWVFLEDPDDDSTEVVRLRDATGRFGIDQVIEIGAILELESHAQLEPGGSTFGTGNPLAGGNPRAGNVSTLRIEGWVHMRVSRPFG